MGIRGMTGSLTALRSAAMTRGKSVYPMMQTVWKKALGPVSILESSIMALLLVYYRYSPPQHITNAKEIF